MSDSNYRSIITDGLWHNNQALVALLGLCPMLAVTNTAINGLGLGMATTLVLAASNSTVSLIRHLVRPEVRLPVFVLVIASFVTAIELTMNAFFHELHKILGIFIPLIVTNCTIIGRAEAFASKNSLPRSLVDGLSIGIGFTLVLMTLGAITRADRSGHPVRPGPFDVRRCRPRTHPETGGRFPWHADRHSAAGGLSRPRLADRRQTPDR